MIWNLAMSIERLFDYLTGYNKDETTVDVKCV